MNKVSIGKRQNGVVAILVGISMFLFMVLLALVIDLGHLYVAKTGLQNAADAAALSGAKELIQTGPGITAARDRAIEAAGNNTFFGDLVGTGSVKGWQPVVLAEDNIMFSDSPYTPDADWLSYSEALAAPVGLTFIKVDTGSQSLHTFFGLWERFMSTFGRAVAGRFVTNVTPIGICAIDEVDGASDEFGFRRGVGYNVDEVNERLSGLAPGTKLYLDPTATSQETCDPVHGNANFIEPFLCTGQSAISGTPGSTVYANTGNAACKSIGALNTRFDLYDACLDATLTPASCAPDENVKEYTPNVADIEANWMDTTQPPSDQTVIWRIAEWLALTTNSQPPAGPMDSTIAGTKENQGGCKDAGVEDCSDNYGVLWTYTRPVGAVPTVADWDSRYPSGPSPARVSPSGKYLDGTLICSDPDFSDAPYCYGLENQGGGTTPYFRAPSHDGARGRRLVNLVILDCEGVNPGICGELRVLGVGQFFMQARADNPALINGEFVKLIEPGLLDPTIRLYQ